MGTWIVRWNFDAANYSPGQSATVSLWLDNTGDTSLYPNNFKFHFDFGSYDLTSIAGQVEPKNQKFLGSINLDLPSDVVGHKLFSFEYMMQEYIANNWISRGIYKSDQAYFISIYPQPLYTVFLSRGIHIEDRVIGDPLAEMIREWGINTVTVGIEVQADESQVVQAIRQNIRSCDGLIAIATPRYLDSLTGLWRTLEWCHGEVGMAFGVDKPLMILRDNRVTLGGLPSYLSDGMQTPELEFSPYNVEELRYRLGTVMPGFRTWLETRRQREFNDSLKKVVVGSLAVVGTIKILAGIFGSSGGQSR